MRIVAIDTADSGLAERQAAATRGLAGIKLGLEFFCAHGHQA